MGKQFGSKTKSTLSVVVVVLVSIVITLLYGNRTKQVAVAQTPKNSSDSRIQATTEYNKMGHGLFHNERLKTLKLPDRPIMGDSKYRLVEGVWLAESKDPNKQLVFPQQVKIDCHSYGRDNRKCVETAVAIAPVTNMVSVHEIDTEEFEIDKWDAHGLIASYGGEAYDSDCQRHVLTMDFDTGGVSVVDIPTHRKGCEAFTETDSYRLVRGFYWVDTSPNNDFDRPVK